jgi:hypothetical protein
MYLCLYSHFLGRGRFFSFLILYTVGWAPWTGDQPVARPLFAHRTTQKQNKHTQTSISRVGFEPTIPVFELAKTVHALDRAATEIGICVFLALIHSKYKFVTLYFLLIKQESKIMNIFLINFLQRKRHSYFKCTYFYKWIQRLNYTNKYHAYLSVIQLQNLPDKYLWLHVEWCEGHKAKNLYTYFVLFNESLICLEWMQQTKWQNINLCDNFNHGILIGNIYKLKLYRY